MVQAAAKPAGGSFSALDDVSTPGRGAKPDDRRRAERHGDDRLASGGRHRNLRRGGNAPRGRLVLGSRAGQQRERQPLLPRNRRRRRGRSDRRLVRRSRLRAGHAGGRAALRRELRRPRGDLRGRRRLSSIPTRRWTGGATRPCSGWRTTASTTVVRFAGYDADPPELSGVSVPSSGTVGSPLRFSASSYDVWPVSAPAFEFGDGASAVGTAVAHAYAAPGSYSVRVTAEDAAGKTAASTATVLVKARNSFKIGKLRRNRRKGTATLLVTVPEPGTVLTTGKGVRKRRPAHGDGRRAQDPVEGGRQAPQAAGEDRQVEGAAEARLLSGRRRHEHGEAPGDAAEEVAVGGSQEAPLTPSHLNRLRRR